jgi:transaldolase
MSDPNNLKIKIFLDGASEEEMLSAYGNPLVKGFTTNPSLMRKAGVEDYEAFARGMVAKMPDRSISFEVFADEPDEMERQAMKITTWGENVYVKIPITNTKAESAAD